MHETPYGVVSSDAESTEVYSTHIMLWDWAHRPGSSWPCSELARCAEVTARFDPKGDLVDLVVGVLDDEKEISSNELNAWTSDVLRLAGMSDHPAVKS
jgi:hypothetical protein